MAEDNNFGLSEQHILFCNEYIIDLNGYAAYIRAGYSPNGAAASASKLQTNPNIRAYIKQKMAERAENAMIDATFVVEGLKEVVNRCKQASPVMKFNFATQQMEQVVDENGSAVWEFDSQGLNKALELLGKHQGVFERDNAQKQAPPADVSIISAALDRLQNK